jgi:hypothetical protein
MKTRYAITLGSIIAALLLGIASFLYITQWSAIRFTESTNAVSFELPRNVQPLGQSATTFREFRQFTVPAYVQEGSEMIPFLQVSTRDNVESFTDTPKSGLTLEEFFIANLQRIFGENPKLSRVTVNARDQFRVCRTNGVRLCSAFMLSNDKLKVIEFTIEYPLQGPRSAVLDTQLESAYTMMMNSVKFK